MKIIFILGTRPEIIKLSPVIRECERLGLNYSVLHTGQHYSWNMDKVFFENLELSAPKFKLNVGSGSHGEQTGKILMTVEKVLKKEKPDIVLVQGDTNSTLAGALAATKLHIKVGHVEAGLRSFYKYMPEEINRVLADHCSDYLFPPTIQSKKNLCREGISEKKIFLVGNTVVDAVYQNIKIAHKTSVLNDLGLSPKKYFLVTIHRQENVENKSRFRSIFNGLEKIGELGFEVVYPIHPRSRKQMKLFNLQSEKVRIIDPVDFFSFLQLESNAIVILTDSGGVQEEACILKVPCVTLRDNTERPETIQVGSNILAGTDSGKIFDCTKEMAAKKKEWKSPFGDGNASKRVIKEITKN